MAASTDRPNVLLFLVDDMRAELGCLGNPIVRTPHLDALAARGTCFSNAYCQYPLCSPSRTSILTGVRPTTSQIYDNRTWFHDRCPTLTSLPQLFRQHGYFTARIGKVFHRGLDDTEAWMLGGLARGEELPTGLQEDSAERVRHSDRIARVEHEFETDDFNRANRVVKTLRTLRGRPFFIGCGFTSTHTPFVSVRRFRNLYADAAVPLPIDFAPLPVVPPGFPPSSVRTRNSDIFIDRPASLTEAIEVIRSYYSAISLIDHAIGRVLEELEKLNLLSSTIVAVVADHGFHLGEKGKWSKAGSLFQEANRVPLIIAAPNLQHRHARSAAHVELIDLYPTLVELCGLPRPSDIEGTSLCNLISHPDSVTPRPAYTFWSEDTKKVHSAAVRFREWLGIEYCDGGGLLFDLKNDPAQTRNLAGEATHAAVRKEIAELLNRVVTPASWSRPE